jgi:predicted anti-sigma-YlaC factor YlaD
MRTMGMISRIFRRSREARYKTICDELRALASDLVDGDCDDELVSRLDAHLAECIDCDSWYESLRETIALLRDLPPRTTPDQVMERIRSVTTHASQ